MILPNPNQPNYQTIQAKNRLIIFVSPDKSLGEQISRQISHFGYDVQIVGQLSNLANLSVEHKRIAILVDLSTLEQDLPGIDLFQEFEDLALSGLPLFFLAERDDHVLRLKSMRAGGMAYFTKPIEIVRLVDKLDELENETTGDPYRILIIEDQAPIASYYQLILKMAGMDAQIADDPLKVLQILEDYHPDLVLMDLYLPQVSGIELAKVIRQMDEYVCMPIVFLSSEDDFNKQIEALNLGGDDFLTKPIRAAHLVALVKSRLERLRTLRTFMVKDSLTGLYNHTSFRGILKHELSRSKRQNNRLALAMLDLDHFKYVNDNHGHMIGDNVLKSLARLLRQRLRKSDLVGRYGGEEFVVLLLDVDENHAVHVLDEIRQHFAGIEFFSKLHEPFSVTFSCGVATYPEFSSPGAIIDAADQAMYRAKALGRNKVVVAHS